MNSCFQNDLTKSGNGCLLKAPLVWRYNIIDLLYANEYHYANLKDWYSYIYTENFWYIQYTSYSLISHSNIEFAILIPLWLTNTPNSHVILLVSFENDLFFIFIDL